MDGQELGGEKRKKEKSKIVSLCRPRGKNEENEEVNELIHLEKKRVKKRHNSIVVLSSHPFGLAWHGTNIAMLTRCHRFRLVKIYTLHHHHARCETIHCTHTHTHAHTSRAIPRLVSFYFYFFLISCFAGIQVAHTHTRLGTAVPSGSCGGPCVCVCVAVQQCPVLHSSSFSPLYLHPLKK